MSTQLIFSESLQQQQNKLKVSQIMRQCKLKQCRQAFYRQDGLDRSYCFLGAVYREFKNSNPIESIDMIDVFIELGLSHNIREDIMRKNDKERWTFTQIADYVEDKYGL